MVAFEYRSAVAERVCLRTILCVHLARDEFVKEYICARRMQPGKADVPEPASLLKEQSHRLGLTEAPPDDEEDDNTVIMEDDVSKAPNNDLKEFIRKLM